MQRFHRLSVERLEDRALLAGFNFVDFSDPSGVNLLGAASVTSDNRLRLTPAQGSTGGAWYTADKSVVVSAFETTFQFRLSTATGGPDGSDGFAFVIQNNHPDELRGGGGALGYDGMPNSLAIEFDAYLNGAPFNDPSQSHISVHTNGTGANSYSESFSLGVYNTQGFILDDAQVHTAKVSYAPGTLTVYLDNLTTPVLTVSLDLATKLNLDVGRAWVGFTGAAGGSPMNQDILNWSFQSDDKIIVADDPIVTEGPTGSTCLATFTITRDGNLAGQAIVNWTIADGTANAGTDYVAASGQMVFLDGESLKTVSVTVNGDSTAELDEAFRLLLSTTASYAVDAGQATILNDDGFLTDGGVYPDDPGFAEQWLLHNTGQTGGLYDADVDAPAAWSITTGSMATVVAILDSGVDYMHPDLYLNVWLNQGEIPAGIAANLTDADSDGLITFRDLNDVANAASVSDRNGNAKIDGGDLLNDPAWENGLDEDNNGKVDDLVGWDFHDNDNDPAPLNLHGTDMAKLIGAIGNNGVGTAGVNWAVRMMPVRIHVVNNDGSKAPTGLDYAVAEGAVISSNSWGNNVFSQEMYDAIDRARQAGHLFVAAAGNQTTNMDVTPFYPAAYGLDNVISVAALTSSAQLSSASNWGVINVDLGGPSPSGGTSGATAHVTGVAALIQSLHPDWGYTEIRDRLLATVEPLTSLAGKTVTGGGVNAARALAATSISISDPTVTEGNSGTTQLVFTVTRVGDDSGSVTLDWLSADGTAAVGSDYVGVSGQIAFLPSGPNVQTIAIDVIGDLTQETTETLFVQLAVASGSALLADGVAQGLILDTDPPPTKFYVVNDAAANRTYEYEATGAAIENYALNSANTTPRGAASTTVGDKVWVVDANKKVYVYTTSGGLLGSWTAGSLASNATVQGIATNGTDVWIVDSQSDKVFKYTGAASRLSGSQNAASSFNLNSGNSSPTDIVTGASSLWVTNDASTNKVFKYTLAGALLGSWTIDAANATPTGITIDPSNVSNIWIVDSGTDKIYQYNSAATRTSGSQSAAAVYSLAPGNTNPQGIADPPPPGSVGRDSLKPSPPSLANITDFAIGQLMDRSLDRQSSRSLETGRHSTRTGSVRARTLFEFPQVQVKLPFSGDNRRLSPAKSRIASVDDLFANWEVDEKEILSGLQV